MVPPLAASEKDPLLGDTGRARVARWVGIAWWACALSIVWNIVEGGFAVYFGLQQQQIALLVFGSQSIIEIVAAALVLYRFGVDKASRVRGDDSCTNSRTVGNVERLGSRGVGVCLVVLSLYACAQAVYNLVERAAPDDSVYGLVVASVSAVAMFLFWVLKRRAAAVLESKVLASDARCSQMCSSV